MVESRSVAITVALIGAAATLGAALIATRPWDDGDGNGGGTGGGGNQSTELTLPDINPNRNVSVFLSRDSGPGGTTVNVSGEGFTAGERVVIQFHTEQMATTTVNEQGAFSNVAAVIPTSFSRFAPQQFDVVATGDQSIRSAQAPFTITG